MNKSYNKKRVFYIIYRNIEKKYPEWIREDVRNATVGLLASRNRRKHGAR